MIKTLSIKRFDKFTEMNIFQKIRYNKRLNHPSLVNLLNEMDHMFDEPENSYSIQVNTPQRNCPKNCFSYLNATI